MTAASFTYDIAFTAVCSSSLRLTQQTANIVLSYSLLESTNITTSYSSEGTKAIHP